MTEPVDGEPLGSVESPSSGSEDLPARARGALPVAPEDVGQSERAFVDHAREAGPLLRSSARILSHADPPVYAELAVQLADRLAAVSWSTAASVRQELIVEERQLIEHLGIRYEGLTELQDVLTALDESLQRMQSLDVEPVASPDPRTRSARGAELPDGD
jgi:hypothetical protein